MNKWNKKMVKNLLAALLASGLVLTGCGSQGSSPGNPIPSAAGTSGAEAASPTVQKGEKTFIFGDTTFNSENEEANINPHDTYCGWAAIRYGVGETLFRFTDQMELEPWIASGYDQVDDKTWKIQIKDGVTFSNGKAVDAAAVKACLEDLVSVHERAAGDLKISSMEADGQTLTVKTAEQNPTLLNYLSDPYGCIIDMEAGNQNGIVIGTGPFAAEDLVTDDHLTLKKNKHYWNGEVKVDHVKVRTISDGDTLALALQSGEIDAAYGMAYASYPLFKNDSYAFSTITTSRAFYAQMNEQSGILKDGAVRKALAMGIAKEDFVRTLLRGYGEVANGAFPESFSFGRDVKAEPYDPDGAAKVLEEDGWIDTDGDGIREKDGQRLVIRWLTYPSRQELPLLAESSQASLKKIGIEVKVNVTADHNTLVADPSAWDVYAAAFVTCPTGDPLYFFSTHCLDSSAKNRGGYHSDRIEELARQMDAAFDPKERGTIARQMQQQILDDHAFVFCSFLKMSIIRKASVTGLDAHACDYYELTKDLDIEAA